MGLSPSEMLGSASAIRSVPADGNMWYDPAAQEG